MPFKKGHAKHGGRKKGITTAESIRRDVAVKLAERNFDPILTMVDVAETTKDEALRARMASELSKYVHPQRKAVEHTGAGGGPIELADATEYDLFASRIDRIVQRKRASGNIPGAD